MGFRHHCVAMPSHLKTDGSGYTTISFSQLPRWQSRVSFGAAVPGPHEPYGLKALATQGFISGRQYLSSLVIAALPCHLSLEDGVGDIGIDVPNALPQLAQTGPGVPSDLWRGEHALCTLLHDRQYSLSRNHTEFTPTVESAACTRPQLQLENMLIRCHCNGSGPKGLLDNGCCCDALQRLLAVPGIWCMECVWHRCQDLQLLSWCGE